jgi:hypothetical protein
MDDQKKTPPALPYDHDHSTEENEPLAAWTYQEKPLPDPEPPFPVCCVILRLRGLDTICNRGVQVRVGERGYCTEHAAAYARSFNSLGLAYQDNGSFEDAQRMFQEARALASPTDLAPQAVVSMDDQEKKRLVLGRHVRVVKAIPHSPSWPRVGAIGWIASSSGAGHTVERPHKVNFDDGAGWFAADEIEACTADDADDAAAALAGLASAAALRTEKVALQLAQLADRISQIDLARNGDVHDSNVDATITVMLDELPVFANLMRDAARLLDPRRKP